jgi:hypothetical protein
MRVRYWRLSVEDMMKARYPPERAIHWEIKCIQGEYKHFGVFWFKYGTPYDKEPTHGLSAYYNDISQKKIEELIEMIHSKFGGDVLRRQTRVFFQGSKEITEAHEIGNLAAEISARFGGPVEITVEFDGIFKGDQNRILINLPASKLLEVPGIS